MGETASQITSLVIVYSAVYSGAGQPKHQSSRHWPLWGIHRWPVNSPHKWLVTLKMFPFDDVIILCVNPMTKFSPFVFWYQLHVLCNMNRVREYMAYNRSDEITYKLLTRRRDVARTTKYILTAIPVLWYTYSDSHPVVYIISCDSVKYVRLPKERHKYLLITIIRKCISTLKDILDLVLLCFILMKYCLLGAEVDELNQTSLTQILMDIFYAQLQGQESLCILIDTKLKPRDDVAIIVYLTTM